MERRINITESQLHELLQGFRGTGQISDEADVVEIVDDIMNVGEPTEAKSVYHFLTNFGKDTYEEPIKSPSFIRDEDVIMCANNIVEETFELFECFGARGLNAVAKAMQDVVDRIEINPNKDVAKPSTMAEFLKELTDLGVVQHNVTALAGLHDIYADAFIETMYSNNSKGFTDVDKCNDEVNEWCRKELDMEYCHIHQPIGGIPFYVIKRTSDGKILKGRNYTKADVGRFLKAKDE